MYNPEYESRIAEFEQQQRMVSEEMNRRYAVDDERKKAAYEGVEAGKRTDIKPVVWPKSLSRSERKMRRNLKRNGMVLQASMVKPVKVEYDLR